MKSPLNNVNATFKQMPYGCACGSPISYPSSDCAGSALSLSRALQAFIRRILVLAALPQPFDNAPIPIVKDH